MQCKFLARCFLGLLLSKVLKCLIHPPIFYIVSSLMTMQMHPISHRIETLNNLMRHMYHYSCVTCGTQARGEHSGEKHLPSSYLVLFPPFELHLLPTSSSGGYSTEAILCISAALLPVLWHLRPRILLSLITQTTEYSTGSTHTDTHANTQNPTTVQMLHHRNVKQLKFNVLLLTSH